MAMPLSTFIGTFVWSRQGGPGLTSWSYLCPLIGCRKLLFLPPLPDWPAQFVITADLYNEPLTTWPTSTTSEVAGWAGSSFGSPDYGSLRCLTHIYLGIKVVTPSSQALQLLAPGVMLQRSDYWSSGEESPAEPEDQQCRCRYGKKVAPQIVMTWGYLKPHCASAAGNLGS